MKRKNLEFSTACKKARNNLCNLVKPTLQDRLNSLPDCLLVSILSLLPVKKAAATSVLSHLWRYLWTQISHLRLSYFNLLGLWSSKAEAKVMPFVSTVNNIFQQLTSSKIHGFELEFHFNIKDDTQLQHFDSSLEAWARHICRLNVEEIRVSRYNAQLFCLPFCIFQCQSLVVLHIDGGGFCVKLPNKGIISLPNLRKLTMSAIYKWDSETMSTLFKSCTLLEELDLSLCYRARGVLVDISSQKLRSLKIFAGGCTHLGCKYVVNAPRLESIEFIGSTAPPIFRFETPLSLVKANIKLEKSRGGGEHDLGQFAEVIHLVCSATSLELSNTVLHPLIHLDDGTLPSYSNLAQLRLYVNDTRVCNNLLRCLRCFPNLEVLVIEMINSCHKNRGVEWALPDFMPSCLSSKLKKFEMKNIEGSKNELKILKYMLRNSNALEWLLVGVSFNETTR